MNVTCPNCATVYRVDPAKVPEAGVRARCAVCSAVFAVTAARGRQPASPRPRPEPRCGPRRRRPSGAGAEPPAAEPRRPEPAALGRAGAVADADRLAAPAPAQPPRGPAPPASGAPHDLRTAAPPLERPATPGGGRRPAAPAAVAPRPADQRRPAARRAARRRHPRRPRRHPPPAPAACPPAAAAGTSGSRPVNPFLSQDPSPKARRLARALISDIVVYHPAKRQEGLRDGNLKELFDEEIKKSWEEYADQVGREVAESTGYFRRGAERDPGRRPADLLTGKRSRREKRDGWRSRSPSRSSLLASHPH